MSDVGEYCRQVEDYLTRVNAGHIVRIVGPGFDLVRGWAEQSIPLSIVFRGIERKAERHRHGEAKRPLRIEFCSDDVRAVFEQWRRAVGLSAVDGESEVGATSPKAPSLGKHLERATHRLSKFCSRDDVPQGLRDAIDSVLQAVAALRESSAGARGDVREEAIAALGRLDAQVGEAARTHAPAEWVTSLRTEAAQDLAPFKTRLDADAWARSLDVTLDRLLRDRFGLPQLGL